MNGGIVNNELDNLSTGFYVNISITLHDIKPIMVDENAILTDC